MFGSRTCLFLSGVFALSAAGAAVGAPAVNAERAQLLEKAFGSTIVSTYPDGRQGELWLQRDGTFTGTGRRLTRSSGTWQVKGDKLCLKQHTPFPAPFSFCSSIPAEGLDKPWTGRAVTGEPIVIKLVRGLHGRDPQPRTQGAEAEKHEGPQG